MRCPNCGEEIQPGSRFCQRCNADLSAFPGGEYGGSGQPYGDQGGFYGGPGQPYADQGGFYGGPGQPYADQGGFYGGPGQPYADQDGFYGGPGQPYADQGGFYGGPGQPYGDQDGSYDGFGDQLTDTFEYMGSPGQKDAFGPVGGPGETGAFGTSDDSGQEMNFGASPDWNNNRKTGGKGFPRPLLILICVLAAVLLLGGAAAALDHYNVLRVPVIHSLFSNRGESESDVPETERTAPEEADEPVMEPVSGDDPSSDTGGGETAGPNIDGGLAVTVTDVEPPEMTDYQQAAVSDLDAAPGIDGTSSVNMLSEDNSVWKITKEQVLSEEGRKIRLALRDASVKVIAIKAGNWTSAESYSADARPIRMHLSIGDFSYPLTLNDRMVPHYIVLSDSVDISELILQIDQISDDTTGNFAITRITVYSE